MDFNSLSGDAELVLTEVEERQAVIDDVAEKIRIVFEANQELFQRVLAVTKRMMPKLF